MDNKTKLTGGTLFVIALIVLIFGNARTASMNEKLDEINKELFDLKLQIASLRKDNKELTEHLKRLKPNNSQPVHTISATPHISQTNDIITTSQPISSDEQASAEQLIPLAKQMNSEIAPLQRTKNKFNSEEIDDDWAYDYENSIRVLIESNADSDFIMLDTKCKTTICEVSMMADDNNAIVVGNKLAQLLTDKHWEGQAPVLVFNQKTENGILKLYIGRNLDSLE
jgi:hypothetical protein